MLLSKGGFCCPISVWRGFLACFVSFRYSLPFRSRRFAFSRCRVFQIRRTLGSCTIWTDSVAENTNVVRCFLWHFPCSRAHLTQDSNGCVEAAGRIVIRLRTDGGRTQVQLRYGEFLRLRLNDIYRSFYNSKFFLNSKILRFK